MKIFARWRAGSEKVESLEEVLDAKTRDELEAAGVLSQMRMDTQSGLRPIMLICETINVCNATCVFCPYSKQTRKHGVMSKELFRKVVADYDEIGGGHLSLTPMVGDVLLDPKLRDRVEALLPFRDSITTSLTSNLYALERHSDELIDLVLSSFVRLHVSAYGITEEECRELTGKAHFSRFLRNLKRLVDRWEKSAKTCEVAVGFRLAYPHSDETLEGFLREFCGHVLPFGWTHQYANWGNSMAGSLPGDAEYVALRENRDICAVLAVAPQVYWDGRVSACHCCDYDACGELSLGNLSSQSLKEVFNSEKNRFIWAQHFRGDLPQICKTCTFHYPLSHVNREHPILTNITQFIGG